MKRWVFVLVVGIGFLVVTLLFAREDPSVIKCGGRIMGPGDVCESTKGGRVVDEDTYDQMKAAAESRAETFRNHGLWMAGVGVALTGLGATMLIRGKRRKNRAIAAARQDAQWQAQPGFPQQQGFPQPHWQPAPGQRPYPPQNGWPQQPGPPPQQFGPPGYGGS
ncbi:hypothetical protein [Amycolatopsis keratiniphila]|uniref:hypothetical protein n=1 Tax=Amycolatopsis keratiniphila TaxID=129921 RepID=UPI0008799D14|nr:hypothetical protein [Amycolatopsis keratiniphila]OLZ51978.1 hypothetical protein BS330_25455 [Amycolatopsis keratiniphila subsp. nogabecina]SDU61630.1 hypothetical protein SAMN04489733_7074 [Amycolatopsis keratiniphila]